MKLPIEYKDEKDVVSRIRRQFSDDASRTEDWMRGRGWDDLNEAPHIWIEAFADRTTDAMRAGDWRLVNAHSAFLATEFRVGSKAVRELVDVCYAENIMWDLDTEARIAAWPYIAKEVRDLFVQIWGVHEWMNGC